MKIVNEKRKDKTKCYVLDFKTNFPNKIFEMIEIRLEHIQEIFNNIITNDKENILYKNEMPTTENKKLNHKRLSVFKTTREKQIKRVSADKIFKTS